MFPKDPLYSVESRSGATLERTEESLAGSIHATRRPQGVAAKPSLVLLEPRE